jgi:hypothetical protein
MSQKEQQAQQQQLTPEQIIERLQQELNGLKVRAFDALERGDQLQQALNAISQAAGFTGSGSINDLVAHIGKLANPQPMVDEPAKQEKSKKSRK